MRLNVEGWKAGAYYARPLPQRPPCPAPFAERREGFQPLVGVRHDGVQRVAQSLLLVQLGGSAAVVAFFRLGPGGRSKKASSGRGEGGGGAGGRQTDGAQRRGLSKVVGGGLDEEGS